MWRGLWISIWDIRHVDVQFHEKSNGKSFDNKTPLLASPPRKLVDCRQNPENSGQVFEFSPSFGEFWRVLAGREWGVGVLVSRVMPFDRQLNFISMGRSSTCRPLPTRVVDQLWINYTWFPPPHTKMYMIPASRTMNISSPNQVQSIHACSAHRFHQLSSSTSHPIT